MMVAVHYCRLAELDGSRLAAEWIFGAAELTRGMLILKSVRGQGILGTEAELDIDLAGILRIETDPVAGLDAPPGMLVYRVYREHDTLLLRSYDHGFLADLANAVSGPAFLAPAGQVTPSHAESLAGGLDAVAQPAAARTVTIRPSSMSPPAPHASISSIPRQRHFESPSSSPLSEVQADSATPAFQAKLGSPTPSAPHHVGELATGPSPAFSVGAPALPIEADSRATDETTSSAPAQSDDMADPSPLPLRRPVAIRPTAPLTSQPADLPPARPHKPIEDRCAQPAAATQKRTMVIATAASLAVVSAGALVFTMFPIEQNMPAVRGEQAAASVPATALVLPVPPAEVPSLSRPPLPTIPVDDTGSVARGDMHDLPEHQEIQPPISTPDLTPASAPPTLQAPSAIARGESESQESPPQPHPARPEDGSLMLALAEGPETETDTQFLDEASACEKGINGRDCRQEIRERLCGDEAYASQRPRRDQPLACNVILE